MARASRPASAVRVPRSVLCVARPCRGAAAPAACCVPAARRMSQDPGTRSREKEAGTSAILRPPDRISFSKSPSCPSGRSLRSSGMRREPGPWVETASSGCGRRLLRGAFASRRDWSNRDRDWAPALGPRGPLRPSFDDARARPMQIDRGVRAGSDVPTAAPSARNGSNAFEAAVRGMPRCSTRVCGEGRCASGAILHRRCPLPPW